MTNSMAMPKPKYRINQDRLDKMMAFIRGHWQEYHFSPGTREIAAHLSISTSVVAYYRTHLEKTGFLETHPAGMSRAYVPVEIFKDRPVFPGDDSAIVWDKANGEDETRTTIARKEETPVLNIAFLEGAEYKFAKRAQKE